MSQLKSSQRNNLRKVDFRGSYQIEFAEIVQCVKNNSKTIRSLAVDGENIENDEFLNLIEDIETFEELMIFFGENLTDCFLEALS